MTQKKKSSPKPTSAVKKARIMQGASENSRKTRHMFCIPPAAFGRVARGIIDQYGNHKVSKISPQALRDLQRFAESSMVDHLDKARLVMVGGVHEKKATNKTMTVRYLDIIETALRTVPGARMEAL